MLGVAVGLRLRLLRDEVARLHVVTHQRVGAHLVRVRGRVRDQRVGAHLVRGRGRGRVRVRSRRAPGEG